MPPLRQTNFNGGELAPALHGRTDLDKYATGLRKCQNAIPTVAGETLNRPGTIFRKEVKNSARYTRVYPFIRSETEAYVLEFGQHPSLSQGYIRFFTAAGAPVETSPGVPYEVVTTYLEADIGRLKFSQVGNVLTITNGNYGPAELIYSSPTSWSFTFLGMGAGAGSAPNPFSYFPALSTYPPALYDAPLPVADATHFQREWVFMVTARARLPNGVIIETRPVLVTTKFTAFPPTPRPGTAAPALLVIYPDTPIRVDWTAGVGVSGNFELLGYSVYKGRGKTMGWLGDTPNNWFYDYGDEPDFLRPPPQGRDPFEVLDASGGSIGYHLPGTVAHVQQRRVFGAGKNYTSANFGPTYFWASKVGDFHCFDAPIFATADSAFELELASDTREEIRSLLGTDKALLFFTDAGVWIAAVDTTFIRDSVRAFKRTGVGAAWLDPLVAHDNVLYVRAMGGGVQELGFSTEKGGYEGADLSVYTDFFKFPSLAQTASEWAWARDPFNVIWIVRGDGTLLGLTYNRQQQVFAWHWHDSEAGGADFQSICVVPFNGEHVVFVVVQRNVNGSNKRYLESFATRNVVGATIGGKLLPVDAVMLDCSKTRTGSPTASITGLSHLEGKSVMALADGLPQGPFTVTGGAITLTTAASTVTVGLPYKTQWGLLEPRIDLKTRPQAVTKVVVEVDSSTAPYVGEAFEDEGGTLYQPVPKVTEVGTKLIEVPIRSSWNKRGRAVVVHKDPTPMALVGVTRELEVGDDRR